jgi:hypothetical protein
MWPSNAAPVQTQRSAGAIFVSDGRTLPMALPWLCRADALPRPRRRTGRQSTAQGWSESSASIADAGEIETETGDLLPFRRYVREVKRAVEIQRWGHCNAQWPHRYSVRCRELRVSESLALLLWNDPPEHSGQASTRRGRRSSTGVQDRHRRGRTGWLDSSPHRPHAD